VSRQLEQMNKTSHQLSSDIDGVVLADEQGAHQARGQVPLWGDGALIQLGQTLGVSLQGPVICCQPPNVAKRAIGGNFH